MNVKAVFCVFAVVVCCFSISACGGASGSATLEAAGPNQPPTPTPTPTPSTTPSPRPIVVVPSIATQPFSQTVDEGTRVVFSVAALGDAPLLYQWQRNGVDVPGATQMQYGFVAEAADSGSTWSVRVRNASTTAVQSQEAKLTVNLLRIRLLALNVANPGGLVLDAEGNVYVNFGKSIRKISPNGVNALVAGDAAIYGWGDKYGWIDGVGENARFSKPGGLVRDRAGNLYVGDTLDDGEKLIKQGIRKISPSGEVTTLTTWASLKRGLPNNNFGPPTILAMGDTQEIFAVANGERDTWGFFDQFDVLRVSLSGSVSKIGDANGPWSGHVGLAVDSQSKLHVTGYWGSYQIIDPQAPSLLHDYKIVNAELRAIAFDKYGTGYASDGYRIGYLPPIGGMFSGFAGVHPTALDANMGQDIIPGDFPGQLGRVSAMTFGADGLLYVIANNSVLRIRVP